MIRNLDVFFADTRFSVLGLGHLIRHKSPRADRGSEAVTLFHQHTYYELHLIVGGRSTFSLTDGKPVEVEAGEIIVFPPRTEHMSNLSSNDFESIVFSFSMTGTDKPIPDPLFPVFKERLDACAGRAIPLSRALVDEFDGAEKRMRTTAKTVKGDGAIGVRDLWAREVEISRLLLGLLDELGVLRDDEYLPFSFRSDTAMMLDDLVSDFSVDLRQIADRMGYSTRQVLRLIREHYGKTLTELRRDTRMASFRKVADKYPEMSVYEAARAVGFPNNESFARALFKEEGCTPTEYEKRRKAIVKEETES